MERCPQCGNPRYVCQNDDPDVDFRIYDETCNAMRKKKKAEDAKAKKDKDRDGIIVGIEPYTHSDTPLDLFREPFYDAKAKSAAKRDELRPRRPRQAPPGQTPGQAGS